MTDNKIRIISVSGPTASGKTALSVELALRFNGEIVSADSMQIYEDMDIATAKPTDAEKKGIPHHLMGFVKVGESYSVARFVEDANEAISGIVSRNKLPILVGGTGLYTDSLLNGINFCEGETDYKLRENLQHRCENEGLDTLLSELAGIDAESAKRLSKERNPKRIVRALEVYYTTGATLTEQNKRSKLKPSKYSPVKVGLTFRDREKLYERINKRVDIMLSQGILAETEKFISSSVGATAVQAIGYKELIPYFRNEKSLDDCIETLKRSTRRYAKRQLTWFMRDKDIKWFYVDDYDNYTSLVEDVCNYLCEEGFDFV